MNGHIKAVALDFGGTISGEATGHLIGHKPVDPAAAAAVRTLHDDHGLRIILASNTLPCQTRWPALQQAGIDSLFSQPVAILLMIVIGHIGNPGRDSDQVARAVTGQLAGALPPGGSLALADLADTDPGQNAALAYYNQTGAVPYHARTPEQVTRFFDGLELAGPRVVPVHRWRPGQDPFTSPGVPAWGGVAAKRPPPADCK